MGDETILLTDDTVLVISGLAEPDDEPDDEYSGGSAEDALVLGTFADFVQDLAVQGAVFGTAGGAAWDLVKAVASDLRARGLLGKDAGITAADAVARVRTQAEVQGHDGQSLVVDSTVAEAGRGWRLSGTISNRRFDALLDDSGHVLLLRIVD